MGTFFGLAFKKYGHPVIAIVIGEMIIQLMFNGFVALGAPTTIQNVVTGVAPVSYTHLDVYKRQVQYILKSKYVAKGVTEHTIMSRQRSRL